MNKPRHPLAVPKDHPLAILHPSGLSEMETTFVSPEGEICTVCNVGPAFEFSMAFQPIVDVQAKRIFAYEALARGPNGESLDTMLEETLHHNHYAFDQRCREKAIEISARLGILATGADLSINFSPNAVYQPAHCLRRTFAAASLAGLPLNRLIFEVTEVEKVHSQEHLRNIMTEYRKHGLRVAIDDFGAGHSGLSLLSVFQPDIIKIDRALIHKLHERSASRSIVRSIVQICAELNIIVIAEGIEQEQEMQVLCDLNIYRMQGYFFAKPALEALPRWPPEQDPAA